MRTFSACYLLAVFFALSAITPSNGQTADETRLKIKQAWEARQTRLADVAIRWKVKLSDTHGIEANPFAATDSRNDLIETTSEFERMLRMSGEKYRFDDGRPAWSPQLVKLLKRRTISIYDGNVFRQLQTNQWPEATNRAQGLVTNDDSSSLFFESSAQAVMQHIRPFDRFEAIVANGKIHKNRESIDGKLCWVIATEHRMQFWISPDEGYSIRKVVARDRLGKKLFQDDRQYKQINGHWQLSGWELTFQESSSNKPRQVHSAEVLELKAGESHREETWSLLFPTGTVVMDTLGPRPQWYVAVRPKDLERPEWNRLIAPVADE